MDAKKKKDVDLDEELDELEELDDIEEEKPKKHPTKKEKDVEDDDEDLEEDEDDDSEDDEDEDEDKDEKVKASLKESKKDSKKTEKKSKDDDEDDDEDEKDDLLEEEGESSGAKIVIFLVIVAIIIILLLKACGGKKEEFKVSFDTRGGSAVTSLKVEKDGTIKKPTDPVREGYKFVGWYYKGTDKEFDFNTKITDDIQLEARWEEAQAADVKVTGVTLNNTSLAMKPGETATLIAKVAPSDAKDKSLTWESSNTKVVTVDENGNIKALKAGSATITVTTTDGGYKATAKITVAKNIVPVTGVTINSTTVALATNESKTLKATVKPSDATNKGVKWTSSNPKVVSVSSNGTIKGLKEGTATITVTTNDGSYTATVKVTVKDQAVTGITLKGKTSMKVGDKQTLKATIKPANASNKGLTWKSSDTSVATVDSNGKVTAKKAGNVTITATAKDGSGKKATIKIKVEAKTVSYTMTLTPITDAMGDVKQYKYTVKADSKTFTDYKKIYLDGESVAPGSGTVSATVAKKYKKTKTVEMLLTDGTKVNIKVTAK